VEDLRLSYSVNGQDYPAQSISIAAGKTKEDTVFIKLSNVGWQKLTLKIQDFPVQFDDEYHMSFEVSANVNVLLIYENKIPELIVQALKSLPYFTLSVQEYRALNYNSFHQNQLIILYQLPECSSGLVNELRKASEAKSNLLLFPPAQLMTGAYDNLYQSFRIPRLVNFERSRKEVSELNMEAELFNDVFSNAKANIRLPGSQGQYRLESQGVSEKILQYRDGQSMLIRTPMEYNFFYVFSCPFEPEYSDLSKSAEFTLPLFFKAALYHKNSTPYSYTIGNDPIIHWPLPKSDGKQELVIRLKGVEEFLPGVRRMGQELLIEIYDQVNKAGIYDLTNGDEVLGSVAFNDNRKESNLDVYTVQELKERYGNSVTIMDQSQSGDVAGRIREQQSGSQWWKFLLFFGIICLFVEGTLIRYWKSH
jgi:hypothetical protein